MKILQFKKHLILSTIVFLIVAVTWVFYDTVIYNKSESKLSILEECKNKCHPRFGEIKGERRFPNVSQYERRNYETNHKCVCS
jgi:hypothetical protein